MSTHSCRSRLARIAVREIPVSSSASRWMVPALENKVKYIYKLSSCGCSNPRGVSLTLSLIHSLCGRRAAALQGHVCRLKYESGQDEDVCADVEIELGLAGGISCLFVWSLALSWTSTRVNMNEEIFVIMFQVFVPGGLSYCMLVWVSWLRALTISDMFELKKLMSCIRIHFLKSFTGKSFVCNLRIRGCVSSFLVSHVWVHRDYHVFWCPHTRKFVQLTSF